MIKNAARHTVRWSYIFTGVLLILLALFTATARVGLPLLEHQKSHIEARVSDYLESPVEIGSLSLRWEGFGPMLLASDVAVLETAQRKVALNQLLIDINLPESLLRGIPIINELSLIGANLAIEADAAGQLKLHGMESISRQPGSVDVIASEGKSKGVDVFAWLFNAKKVGLLDTKLTLIDLMTDRQLVLEDLNIRAESNGNVHQLRIDAQLPDSLGGRVEAGIDLVSKDRDLAHSNGNLYMAADALNVRALTKLLNASGLLADQDIGALTFDATASVDVWGKWEDGQLVSARGPLSLDEVVDRESGETLFDRVTATLSLVRSDVSTELSVKDLNARVGSSVLQIEQMLVRELLTTATNANDNAEQVEPVDSGEAQVVSSAAPVRQLSVLASELSADLVVRLARMAFSGKRPLLQRSVRSLSANGVVRNLSLNVTRSLQAPTLDLSAQIDELDIHADEQQLSFGPISGDIAIVDSVGLLSLRAQKMPLSWSAQSQERLTIDSLNALVDIDVRDPQRLLLGGDIQLVADGIDTNTRLSATLVSGQSPHLDIQSRFEVADITVLKSWLPRKSLSPALTNWVDRAITAGKATNGTVLFFGNVDDFPFKKGEGVFFASTDISDGELGFLPDWPKARKINASVELDGLRLSAMATESTLAQFNVTQANATIRNVLAPVLEFAATADGRFNEVVEFGVSGPLREILRPAIGDMSGNGRAQMDLELAVSLFPKPPEKDNGPRLLNWRPFKVNGSLFLDRNDVTFGRAGLRLQNAVGAVGFNESGIRINNLAGKVLGHDVTVTGETRGRGSAANTIVTLKGSMEANDLLAHYGNSLDQFITGASQWTVKITAPHSEKRVINEGVGLEINSDLVGAKLLLPVPFNKAGASPVAFTLSTAFRQDAAEQIWEARYGSELSASLRLIDDNMYSLLIELGEIRLADAMSVLEKPGIRLQGAVHSLAADKWVETISQYIDSFPSDGGDPQPILPVSVALDTNALIFGSRSVGKASLQSNTDDTYLNFTVSNPALSGSLRYPREHWRKDLALKARIKLLDWSVIDALTSNPQTNNVKSSIGLDPRILPPIEARVSALVRNKIRVRDVVLRTYPNDNGVDITTLGFAYDTMRLVGQGHWLFGDAADVEKQLSAGHQTKLDLVLQSDDFGIGLDEVGISGILDDAQGSVVMKLRWPGPLYEPDIASLDGDISMNLQAGSIVPFEPGAGRMMGLFAIQTLPRRLNLDFKDVTGHGLAFSSIVGNAVIDDGVAQVPLLQMTGPIGVIDIVGESDLNAQQFDSQVTVLPRISAALPVIGAISGGASAGIGALVAAGFLKALGLDFDRIGLRTYSMTGPWADPELTPIPVDLRSKDERKQ